MKNLYEDQCEGPLAQMSGFEAGEFELIRKRFHPQKKKLLQINVSARRKFSDIPEEVDSDNE